MKYCDLYSMQRFFISLLFVFLTLSVSGQEVEIYKLPKYQTPVPIPHSRIWYVTYNLGTTGARGWIRGGAGHTRESLEILVKSIEPSSPADGILRHYDVIIGARLPRDIPPYRWKKQPPLRKFNEDARLSFARAITWAESVQGNGVLELLVSRGGKIAKVIIKIPVIGNYANAEPIKCEKSIKIAENAAQFLADAMPIDGYRPGIGRPKAGLHLLGMMDARYLDHVRRTALRMSVHNKVSTAGHETWRWGNTNLFLCEYYLATGDKRVLPTIEEYSQSIAAGQCNPGTWGHRAVPDFVPPGYGSMNASGIVCFLSLVLARDIGITQISEAIENSARFYGAYAGVGSIPYGDHPANYDSTGSGKNGSAALAFRLLGAKHTSQWFARLCASANLADFEAGHSGNYFNQVWTPLGSRLSGDRNYANFWGRHHIYRDMARRHDGSFIAQPQPDGREGDLGSRNYVRKGPIWTTGGYALAYIAGNNNLAVLGREESVFGTNTPSILLPALKQYFAKDFANAITLATAAGKAGDKRIKALAKQLIQISKLNLESLDMTLEDMRESLKKRDLLKVKLQLEGLGSIIAEDDQRLEIFQKVLRRKSTEEILDDGAKYYDVIKSIDYRGLKGFEYVVGLGASNRRPANRHVSELLKKRRSPYYKLLKAHLDGLPEARPDARLPLISLNERYDKPWKVFSDLKRFPKSWEKYRFDDGSWDSVKTPTDLLEEKHLLRKSFHVNDLANIDYLVLEQECAGIMHVYLNGTLILDLDPQSGATKHSRRSIILHPDVLSLLKKGKNLLAVAVDNTKSNRKLFDLGLNAALKK